MLGNCKFGGSGVVFIGKMWFMLAIVEVWWLLCFKEYVLLSICFIRLNGPVFLVVVLSDCMGNCSQ